MGHAVRASTLCERYQVQHAARSSKFDPMVRLAHFSGAELRFPGGAGRQWTRTRGSTARAASVDTEASVVSDPFADKILYNDNLFSRVLIGFITMKISDEVGACPSTVHDCSDNTELPGSQMLTHDMC